MFCFPLVASGAGAVKLNASVQMCSQEVLVHFNPIPLSWPVDVWPLDYQPARLWPGAGLVTMLSLFVGITWRSLVRLPNINFYFDKPPASGGSRGVLEGAIPPPNAYVSPPNSPPKNKDASYKKKAKLQVKLRF